MAQTRRAGSRGPESGVAWPGAVPAGRVAGADMGEAPGRHVFLSAGCRMQIALRTGRNRPDQTGRERPYGKAGGCPATGEAGPDLLLETGKRSGENTPGLQPLIRISQQPLLLHKKKVPHN